MSATINKTLSAPLGFITHTLTDVNQQLGRARPFFTDILKQGYALYEAEGFPCSNPRDLPPEEARQEAQEHFDEWFPSAGGFQRNAGYAVRDNDRKLAAFLFHQAVERLYYWVLLVLVLYSPKSHRLSFLRSQAEQVAPQLVDAWPRDDLFSRRCFELLRQAYVNARYWPHYEITDEELAWLANHVAELQALVEQVCRGRLAA